MANNTLETRILICNDTTANWASSDKVLLKGEVAIEFTTDGTPLFKVGNGTDTFADLPYAMMSPDQISSAISTAISGVHTHANKAVLDQIQVALTTALKSNYDAAYTHSTSAHAPSNAQANVIESVEVNGHEIAPTSKTVDVTIKGTGSVSVSTDSSGVTTINGTDTKYTHPNSGVTAGTYKSVTVNAQGHVTAGSNPTTLAGYGITDALKTSQKGAVNGVAELDASGKVPASQLPGYVDDVVEGYLSGGKFYEESGHTTKITGESGKIYVDLSTNKTYRWSGSAFVVISETLALGETSSTAYRGDRGKIAYDHSQTAHAPANAEVNQNAFSNVKVGATTIAADSKTDTLEIAAGSNVTITPDATGDKITISAKDTNTTYSAGTGLSLSGTTINHKNSVTAGTAQGNASKTLAYGGTFTIPTVTYDAQGHITGKGTTTMTMPGAPTSVSGNAGTATKLQTARTIGLGTAVTATARSFDGTKNITIPITALNAMYLNVASGDTLILNGGGAA